MRAAGNAGGGKKLFLPQMHTDETQMEDLPEKKIDAFSH